MQVRETAPVSDRGPVSEGRQKPHERASGQRTVARVGRSRSSDETTGKPKKKDRLSGRQVRRLEGREPEFKPDDSTVRAEGGLGNRKVYTLDRRRTHTRVSVRQPDDVTVAAPTSDNRSEQPDPRLAPDTDESHRVAVPNIHSRRRLGTTAAVLVASGLTAAACSSASGGSSGATETLKPIMTLTPPPTGETGTPGPAASPTTTYSGPSAADILKTGSNKMAKKILARWGLSAGQVDTNEYEIIAEAEKPGGGLIGVDAVVKAPNFPSFEGATAIVITTDDHPADPNASSTSTELQSPEQVRYANEDFSGTPDTWVGFRDGANTYSGDPAQNAAAARADVAQTEQVVQELENGGAHSGQ